MLILLLLKSLILLKQAIDKKQNDAKITKIEIRL